MNITESTFAAALRTTQPKNTLHMCYINRRAQWRNDCKAVAGVLAANSGFDHSLFLKACGLTDKESI